LCSARLGVEIVLFKIGLIQLTFAVHKKLLCSKIRCFRSMFEGAWNESGESQALFPEDSVESFDLLITWLYTGTIRYACENRIYRTGIWDYDEE